MEVAVELVDFSQCLFGAVNQAHQLQVVGQNVVVGFQLVMDKVQCALPKRSAGHIEQNHRYQRGFTGLHQCQHFQHFIQRAKPARAHHQCIGFLGEEQFAGKEKVKRQHIGRAIDGGVGPLLKWQGDIEPQAVGQARAFMGRGHDACAAAGDDHHVVFCQHGPHFPG